MDAAESPAQTPPASSQAGAAPAMREREREGVVDLLGAIAYGAIAGFTRLAADSELAEDLGLKRALAGMAVTGFHNHELLVRHIEELGCEPNAAMAPFRVAFDSYHARTKPRDLLEGLVKAYIGDGIANDFFLEIARFVDPDSQAIIRQASAKETDTDVIVDAVRSRIHADRKLGGPLALWGRRLVGEALTQGQVVAGQRDALSELVLGLSHDRPGANLEELGQIMQRLTDAHQRRMGRLGLSA